MNIRLVATVAFTVVATVFVLAYAAMPTEPDGGPGKSARPAASTSAPALPTPAASLELVVVEGGRFGPPTGAEVRDVTAHKNQSKLWFADGSWWGVLMEPTTLETRIHRLDWETQRWHDTGTVVDERPFARADVLWDGQHLYVASAGARDYDSHAARVTRFTYEVSGSRFTLDPDFPMTLTPNGVESIVIEGAVDGTLWVAYIRDRLVQVAHTLGDDHHWTAPFVPPVTGADVLDDQVGLIAFDDRIGLLWSNQGDDAIYFTSHVGGAPDEEWAPAETASAGLKTADDHVNVKALPDGRIFAVVKTSLDTVPGGQPGWDQVLLLLRETDGRWRRQQVGQVRDHHTRPIVLLDAARDEVLVFATTPTRGGAIHVKRASLDALRFPVGLGTPAVEGGPGALVNNATSTKQVLDETSGLVVLASDGTTGRYWHAAASLGGPPPGRPAGPVPAGPVPAPAAPVVLVDDTFDAFAPGDVPSATWKLSSERSAGVLQYLERAFDDTALRAQTSSAGAIRPCRAFAGTASGTVSIAADLRVDRLGRDDATLLMVRAGGREIGGVRVDRQLRLRYADGEERVTSEVRIAVRAWYRIKLEVDPVARRYDLAVVDPSGAAILRRSGLAWRGTEPGPVDGLCIEPSSDAAGHSLTFDAVRVVRQP